MNTRIKEVRTALGMTQTAFGERIGFSRPMVANLEGAGRAEIKEHTIHLICKEYNVNKDWLTSGEGEMFLVSPIDEEIATFIGKIQMDDKNNFKKRFIAMLSKLDESEWEFLEQKAKEIVGYDKKMD